MVANDPQDDGPPALAIVCWRGPDGHEGIGSPLPLATAQAMLQLYAARYRDRQYWIVPQRSDR
jgi:hypothetical protein